MLIKWTVPTALLPDAPLPRIEIRGYNMGRAYGSLAGIPGAFPACSCLNRDSQDDRDRAAILVILLSWPSWFRTYRVAAPLRATCKRGKFGQRLRVLKPVSSALFAPLRLCVKKT